MPLLKHTPLCLLIIYAFTRCFASAGYVLFICCDAMPSAGSMLVASATPLLAATMLSLCVVADGTTSRQRHWSRHAHAADANAAVTGCRYATLTRFAAMMLLFIFRYAFFAFTTIRRLLLRMIFACCRFHAAIAFISQTFAVTMCHCLFIKMLFAMMPRFTLLLRRRRYLLLMLAAYFRRYYARRCC